MTDTQTMILGEMLKEMREQTELLRRIDKATRFNAFCSRTNVIGDDGSWSGFDSSARCYDEDELPCWAMRPEELFVSEEQ